MKARHLDHPERAVSRPEPHEPIRAFRTFGSSACRILALGVWLLAAPALSEVPAVDSPSDVQTERGAHALRDGRLDDARGHLEAALEITPNDPRALALYAQAQLLSGDALAALGTLDRLRQRDPNAPGLDYLMGLANYRLEDWTQTRDHLQAALENVPGHAVGHLLLGVAYQNLDQPKEAQREFAEAARLDPSLEAQVAYRRGLLSLGSQNYREAREFFETVGDRLPGSPLARSAATWSTYLMEIAPRPWELYATAGIGYDSNLNLASDDDAFLVSDESDGRGIFEAGGSYQFGGGSRSLRVGQTLYGHFYFDDTNFNQQISRTWAQAVVQLDPRVTADARYTFEFAWVDMSQFRQTQAIEPGITLQINSVLSARAFYRYDDRDFFFETPSPELFDRTGEVQYGGADLYWSLPPLLSSQPSWLRIGYLHRQESARGDQYDAKGNQPIVTLSLGLPAEFSAVLDGRIEWRDYDEPAYLGPGTFSPATGTREDRISQLRIAIQRAFGAHFELEANYGYTNRNSNVPSFDYDRHVVGLLATYLY
ncbi:tetratricopeptide repeat protein [Myxococcota bacterium]|nr:tetratricopeptide repeat protein [Myxococcota bacterium]